MHFAAGRRASCLETTILGHQTHDRVHIVLVKRVIERVNHMLRRTLNHQRTLPNRFHISPRPSAEHSIANDRRLKPES
jgi:hypothetical protein